MILSKLTCYICQLNYIAHNNKQVKSLAKAFHNVLRENVCQYKLYQMYKSYTVYIQVHCKGTFVKIFSNLPDYSF